MELRDLGRTGLRVSALGFGCGNVGGLMVRGTPSDRERAVARAVELGINYFDTAPSYGDGESERNLGRVLEALRPPVVVGTKFRLEPGDLTDIRGAVARSLEESLRRLRLERVDLLQLHNLIARERSGTRLAARDVLQELVPALETLQRQGKLRFFGITALGETAALHEVVGAGVLHTAQVCFNLLNPSAGFAVPAGFPAQDFARLLPRARASGLGVIGIRALAAGALSGVEARHPVAVPTVEPIASGPDYRADVARARALADLVREGHARSLVEAAMRFVLSSDAVSTFLIGYSSLEHLEEAAAAVGRGPLGPAALDRLAILWKSLADAAATAPGT
jgi:L-galactose dehydrogenase/L-glyceraldehyde 3-phosphate reductase